MPSPKPATAPPRELQRFGLWVSAGFGLMLLLCLALLVHTS